MDKERIQLDDPVPHSDAAAVRRRRYSTMEPAGAGLFAVIDEDDGRSVRLLDEAD